MKKFYKDIQPHFSLNCQDPTLFQFSSNLWQLISTFQGCLSISRAFSHYPIYYLKMISSAPMNSTVISVLIVKIHIFNTNLILTSQPIVLKHLPVRDLKINMFQTYYLSSLSHSQIMFVLLGSLNQWFQSSPSVSMVHPWIPRASWFQSNAMLHKKEARTLKSPAVIHFGLCRSMKPS